MIQARGGRAVVDNDAASTAVPGYRAAHQDAHHARDYDRDFGSHSSAKALDWQLEQRILDTVFTRHLQPIPSRAIDFACGTGRVLRYLESRVDETVGIDIAEEMVALARAYCPRSRLVRHDVTTAQLNDLPVPVDLVTAFRFFLNAEPELRRDALAWMRSVLYPNGVLVANFHLNPASLRGCYLQLRWAGRRRVPMLSAWDVDKLLAEADFDVIARYGYEYLPYRRDGSQLQAVTIRRWVEKALMGRSAIARLGGAFIVVARPRMPTG